MTHALILVAGGKGVRVGGPLPKQYQHVGGQPLLAHALGHAAQCDDIGLIQPVIGAEHRALYDDAAGYVPHALQHKIAAPVAGGATRQESTKAGLDALPKDVESVLVHDAARAFLPQAVVDRLLAAIRPGVGAIPVIHVPDSVKRLDSDSVIEELDRSGLALAQTPQAFKKGDLVMAFDAAKTQDFTDEASLARHAGMVIHAVLGDEALFKVTQPEDFIKAEAFMTTTLKDVRTGMGFDVHAFEEGDQVILCGIAVPHSHKLKGHSDADVGLHAITDAVLGAISAGDIGDHFPPSDPQWKGAASDQFLLHAAKLVTQKGGLIAHLDLTLICERPKIGPHRQAMAQNIAKLLGLDHDRVSIKATTTEKLGFTGRQEGIAAQAIATVRLP
ncbi:MAG: bifunctional 2-C-methyl-D-erythritol 4-phosphate cytidylyltransferase/2-C-methyl-D-erythritol 2,4-cyclodiphosphate synthase [Pseudomonadota bacterium]